MGDGANRVLAEVVGSFCEGRLSVASGLEAIDMARHPQKIHDICPEAMFRLRTIIFCQISVNDNSSLFVGGKLFN